MNTYSNIKAKGLPDNTSLYDHLSQVAEVSRKFAHYLNLDEDSAYKGAILHDIGKASTVFQSRLISKRRPDKPFRHEIASCFFLSLFDEAIHPQLIEMVIGHHKSVLHDSRDLGILDLVEYRTNTFQLHIKDWDNWQIDALNILKLFVFSTRKFTKDKVENKFK